MGDAIINIIVLFINLVDTVVVNWWTQAPQGGRVLALFLFIGAVYLMGELKGEDNANKRKKYARRKRMAGSCKRNAHSSELR